MQSSNNKINSLAKSETIEIFCARNIMKRKLLHAGRVIFSSIFLIPILPTIILSVLAGIPSKELRSIQLNTNPKPKSFLPGGGWEPSRIKRLTIQTFINSRILPNSTTTLKGRVSIPHFLLLLLD
jgi:hypothetical protein